MRIALAQINPVLGAFKSNSKKIVEFTKRAHQKHAQLVVFSEMSLYGYPATDSLELSDLVQKQLNEITKISSQMPPGITAIIGVVVKNSQASKQGGKTYMNAAAILCRGAKPRFIIKRLLPSYDVFDETRFFEAGDESGVVQISGIGRVAVSICEDMWADLFENKNKVYKIDPFRKYKGVDLLVNISASPFSKTHMAMRIKKARSHAKKIRAPFVYVNQVGGQDELIFDGGSFILDKKGQMIVQAALFEEDLVISDMTRERSEYRPPETDPDEILRKALVLGLRDFVKKTNNTHVHLGISGGIDSSVAAALAVDALGPSHVTGFILPGPYNSSESVKDALLLAENLGIKTQQISISELYEKSRKTVGGFLTADSSDSVSITEQNIQARLRGMILMAYSNSAKSLLLTTVNKSELAVGYGTLYGDLCGGIAPLADLTKKEVYALARHYNKGREIIPLSSIKKAPSAELAPGQTDQDTLPPYPLLDKAVINIVERKQSPKGKVEKWLREKLFKSEFKRWQSAPVLRVSDHAFGRGRRMPIAFNPEI